MPKPILLPLEEQQLKAGLRLGIAVSGGADSVALLRALLAHFNCREALGIVLSVVHVHHGIRGTEANEDRDFVQSLASEYALPFHLRQVDVPARVQENSETIEEAARHLRYTFFNELLSSGQVDAVATALYTRNDQAETVLQKLLRGAWTEGLGGASRRS